MIIYASRTNNVKSVTKKLSNINCVDIKSILSPPTEPYLIFTYTDGIGNVPEHVLEFLRSNSKLLRGVIASGNVNFGTAFCLSADKISSEFGVPIVRKLDLRGNVKDLEIIVAQYEYLIIEKG